MEKPENIHGVAVAVGDLGLLILGESGAGKSSLAAHMMAAWPFGRVLLVADDRVLLTRYDTRIIARPHPTIAGQTELRGLGIVSAPAVEATVIRGIVTLSEVAPKRLPDADDLIEELLGSPLPCALLPVGYAAYASLMAIWPYFQLRMLRV